MPLLLRYYQSQPHLQEISFQTPATHTVPTQTDWVSFLHIPRIMSDLWVRHSKELITIIQKKRFCNKSACIYYSCALGPLLRKTGVIWTQVVWCCNSQFGWRQPARDSLAEVCAHTGQREDLGIRWDRVGVDWNSGESIPIQRDWRGQLKIHVGKKPVAEGWKPFRLGW